MSAEQTLEQRAIEAEHRAATWLAEGNQRQERGDKAGAEQCFEKAQFWHDRYNKLVGNA